MSLSSLDRAANLCAGMLGCVTCPLADSYVDRAASEAGAAAEMAATRKEEKYVDLSARYFFEPKKLRLSSQECTG